VVAKVEWHQGERYPRVGFIVTSLKRPAERVSKFYNGRGTAEQWIREGKYALRWTRLSCRAFRDNAVRLQLFALAYNEILEERVASSRGRQVPRGVKRKMTNYQLRPRGPQPTTRIDFATAIRIIK
jgi:hypothetical protein